MSGSELLVRRGRLRSGRIVDIRCVDGVIREVESPSDRRARGVDAVIDAEGGLVLPGLIDHHLHLLAWAAALDSVDLSGSSGLDALAEAPATADGWVRGTGYRDGGSAPLLDAAAIDRVRSDVPVRVQHGGGALWVLNTAGIARLSGLPGADRVLERDAAGRPTGRLWRADDWLASALPASPPSLVEVGRRLAAYGVTAVVDATPGAGRLEVLRAARADGSLPQRVTVLADVDDPGEGLELGPVKLVLDERDPPRQADLADRIGDAARRGRPVAVHCTTRAELAMLLAACEGVRPLPGSRIEHGGVIPDDALDPIRELGLAVVTQPGFIAARGDRYLAEVDPEDVPLLYRAASLRAAGVRLGFSSDAPYGPSSPWEVVRAARYRRTRSGRVLGAVERMPAAAALARFLSAAADPGGPVRMVRVGSTADLAILGPGIRLDAEGDPVAATVIDGRLIVRQ